MSKRKKTPPENNLPRSEQIQNLLLSLAYHFITMTSDKVDDGINFALSELGKFAEVDRCWLIQIVRDAGSNTHEWCAEGIPSAMDFIQDLPIEAVPWMAKKLMNREVVAMASIDSFPEEAAAERQICEVQGLKSFAAVPLLYAGNLTGLVGFDFIRTEKEIPEDAVKLLRIAGEMLGNAIHRKQVEGSRQELDLRFRSVLDHLQEGVSIGDLEDRLIYVNYRYADITGYKVEELIGCKAYKFTIPPEEQNKILEGTKRRIAGQTDSYECVHLHKNGKRIPTIISTTPYRDIHGDVIGYISAITDISELREKDSENQRLQLQLMQAQKMEAVGQLAAGIAHDLNNSLSAIVGHLQLIKSCPDITVDCLKSADTALLGCKRASNLISQLLGFSRHGEMHREVIKLDDIVQETLQLLGSVLSKDVSVRTNGATENLWIDADKSQLGQAITNLIINSNQAMPKGGSISVSYSTTTIKSPQNFNRDAAPGSFVVLTIRDTGEGIAPEALSRVFEPFFTTKPFGQGSGLGLSMVYGIMQRHGGWIEVDSQLGMGTALSLYFPKAEKPTVSQADRQGIEIQKTPSPVELMAPPGTILVIDDEPLLAELACSFLERAGFNTKAFSVPEEAFVWYRKNHAQVSLILLDMKMPGFNGVKSFQVLREINPDARIVLISGYIDDAEVSKLLSQGAVSFIQKPVKYTELVEWVTKTVKMTEPQTGTSVLH